MKKQSAAGSLAEVILFSSTIGASEKDARYFWFKCEGNGWKNAGRAIHNWRATFESWWEAGYFPSQREKYRQKTNLPSAAEVRRVMREHRDRMVGCRDPDTAWERIFQAELMCSYSDAMKVLQ